MSSLSSLVTKDEIKGFKLHSTRMTTTTTGINNSTNEMIANPAIEMQNHEAFRNAKFSRKWKFDARFFLQRAEMRWKKREKERKRERAQKKWLPIIFMEKSLRLAAFEGFTTKRRRSTMADCGFETFECAWRERAGVERVHSSHRNW